MAALRNDIRDWLALVALPGLGCALIHRLLDVFSTPGSVLAAGSAVRQVDGVGPALAALFADQSRLERCRTWAEEEYERVQARDIHLLCVADPQYPDHLRTIHDPPVLLYLRGNLNCLDRPSVALIGSRAATSYGKRISAALAGRFARAGLVVTSGLAMGIDGRAHAGCLAAGGATVAVLGCGVDVVYPRSHGRLYEQVVDRGLLVSEYPLATRPDGFRFPARNRIISGLSRGVVVVEASCKSGSLITARLALDQGRDVFAVPGRIDSMKSEGCHRLIQQGAKLVQSAEDVLLEMQIADAMHCGNAGSKPVAPPEDLSGPEEQLLARIDVYPINIDELAVQTGLASGPLHDLLLRLQLKGCIRQLPGQQYEKV
jgi:DNA processing protein